MTAPLKLFEGSLLVPGLGLNINCKEGNGTVTAKAESKTKKLTGTAAGKFTGCTDKNFGEVCTVMGRNSKGEADPNGTISAEGTGEGSMTGEKVLVTAASSKFAKVEYLGAECPLVEVDGTVSGSITVEVLNPLEDLKLHAVDLVAQNLLFGKEKATLDAPTPAGSITDTDPNATIAIHLCNLTGAPTCS